MIYIYVFILWIGFVFKKSIFFLGVFYIKQELPINDKIREKEVQLISEDGVVLGKMSSDEALKIAEEKNLDLVMVAPGANPPVCKILDYGKYRFEMAKKEKEAKKKQKIIEVKEIRVTPNIEEHDFNFKTKNARKFLADGDKVKISVRFRGRELNNTKAGQVVLERFMEELEDVSTVEKKPMLEGKSMFIILSR